MLSDMMGKSDDPAGLHTDMWIYVEVCDSLFNRAIAAGCSQAWPLMDQFWGDRVGVVTVVIYFIIRGGEYG
jgi:uncharacterized glyoxalase superfamily protein PhnB